MPSSKIHLSDVLSSPRWMTSWERLKHKEAHWFVEMVAEMTGVFLYVYAGVGATAAFVVGSILGLQGLGSLFGVGFAYAVGVTFAICLCAATSGGHFNPSVTIAMVVYRGFPLARAARYIFAQVLAAYLTCLIIYFQWKDLLMAAEKVLIDTGAYDLKMFSSAGPGGVFGFYVSKEAHLGRVFVNEFVTDFVIGLVIWGCLDPTNHMVTPSTAPPIVGLAFGFAAWGFAPVGVATNTARDVGGRMAAMTLWGMKASGGIYAVIAALANIPAMLLAVSIYELFLGSTSRTLSAAHTEFLRFHKHYYEDNGLAPYGYLSALDSQRSQQGSFLDDKGTSQIGVEILRRV